MVVVLMVEHGNDTGERPAYDLGNAPDKIKIGKAEASMDFKVFIVFGRKLLILNRSYTPNP